MMHANAPVASCIHVAVHLPLPHQAMATFGAKQVTHAIDPKLQPWVEK